MTLDEELRHLFAQKRAYHNEWLGVRQIGFGTAYARYGNEKFPEGYPAIRAVLHGQAALFREHTGNAPNTLYIQAQTPGMQVHRHRDPVNNRFGTTIYYAGEFHGGKLVVENEAPVLTGGRPEMRVRGTNYETTVHPGDSLFLRCTTKQQGPWHWTTPVESGVRYTIIFNLIR
jgi:hypothetical protein